tara:strand:- start:103 stop:318 length:216 start_codon:yes stop_codon:yes gene_type:complete
MTLTKKFKKDLSILRAAANKEIYLDVKNPKLYKKVERYYVSEGLVELSGEDPDADYNTIIECIAEDLAGVV